MGAIEQNIVAMAKRCNEPIPERIRNKPRLNVTLGFYLDAFIELDTERDIGMGMGPIPWSSMHAYALFHELSGESYEDFMHLLRALDTAYITHISKRSQASGKSA